MFTGLRQALVLSSSECDFWKKWTNSFRGCSITVAKFDNDVVWTTVLGQDRSETQKTGLGLAHCGVVFVKYGPVTLVVIMIFNDTATFQVLFTLSLFCARNITTVEINSGVYLFKS